MPLNDNEDFFLERREQSFIKAQIVSKYFWIWAKVMAERVSEFYYVDLFSGPGLYDDGSESTPLLIVKNAIRDPKIATRLRLFFNDENFDYINQLQIEIEQLEGYNTLRYKPIFTNKGVADVTIDEIYSGNSLKPTLLFIDPFGYKGLSVDLINVIRLWGSEVIFFFNYKRINMAVNNPVFIKNMKRLFGEQNFDFLKDAFENAKHSPPQREEKITEAICRKLTSLHSEVLKPIHYRFKDEYGTRTTHHLFFATKNVLGYAMVKEVMAAQSSEIQEGVGQMEFNPVTKYRPRLIVGFNIPMLMQDLLTMFAGRKMTVRQIYFEHQLGRNYIEKNYKEALRRLEAQRKIIAEPANRPLRNGVKTMADTVIISFSTTV